MNNGSSRGSRPRSLLHAPDEALQGIRMLATDVDGSMTVAHEIPASVVAAVTALTTAGVEVVPTTGRPAAEAHALARYLPGVRRAIAENGAVLVEPEEHFERLWPNADRQRLLRFGRQVARSGPPLQATGDHFARLVDVAFRRDGRDETSLLIMQQEAAAEGIEMVWSSVHIHFSPTRASRSWSWLADPISTARRSLRWATRPTTQGCGPPVGSD